MPTAVDLFILPRTALVVGFGVLLPALAVALAWPPSATWRRLGLPVAAVAAAAVLAAVFSINPWLSVAGAYTRYESMLVRLAYLGLLAGTAVLCGGGAPNSRERVLRLFLVGCTVAALEAVWQGARHELARPDGNLGQPGLLGALLAMAVPVALQVGLRDWRWLPVLLPLGAGLYYSASRAGWLGALAGCVVFAVLVVPRRWRQPALAVAGAALAIAILVLLLSPLRALNQDTGGARLGVWSDSLRMIAARPLTGWGEDATGLVFGRFQTHDWEPGNTFDRIHDQPLDLLVAQGILGGMAWAWLLGSLGLRWARGWLSGARGLAGPAAACVAYLAWSLLNFDWAPATGAFYVLAGVAWAAVRNPPPQPSPRGRGIPPTRCAKSHTVSGCAGLPSRSPSSFAPGSSGASWFPASASRNGRWPTSSPPAPPPFARRSRSWSPRASCASTPTAAPSWLAPHPTRSGRSTRSARPWRPWPWPRRSPTWTPPFTPDSTP